MHWWIGEVYLQFLAVLLRGMPWGNGGHWRPGRGHPDAEDRSRKAFSNGHQHQHLKMTRNFLDSSAPPSTRIKMTIVIVTSPPPDDSFSALYSSAQIPCHLKTNQLQPSFTSPSYDLFHLVHIWVCCTWQHINLLLQYIWITVVYSLFKTLRRQMKFLTGYVTHQLHFFRVWYWDSVIS